MSIAIHRYAPTLVAILLFSADLLERLPEPHAAKSAIA